MPAIITHDTFGHEVYGKLYEFIGGSRDEAEAFLLGNQGPDPLFYGVSDPRLKSVFRLGSIMHNTKPTELIAAMRHSVEKLPEESRTVGRAYAMGFLCHYELDSTSHPFIFSKQYELCDAGEPGLTRDNGSDVHALIESELDELILTTRRSATIETFNPSKAVLKASDYALNVISAMYVQVALDVYALPIPANTFKMATKAFRRTQALLYSPSGLKHNIIGRIEMKLRPYSFYRAMSHRGGERTYTAFANLEHHAWENPYTGARSTESFVDLFERAQARAFADLPAFDSPSFDVEAARAITSDLDFSGEPTGAQIVSVE